MTTRTDDTDRTEQAAWFENFNPRRDDDAEQAEYLRRWRAQHPAQPSRRENAAWLVVGVTVLLIVSVWMTWLWAAGW